MPASKSRKNTMPPLSRLRRTPAAREHAGGIGTRTLYNWASEGKLTIYKIGRTTYWSIDELDALVTTRTPQPVPARQLNALATTGNPS